MLTINNGYYVVGERIFQSKTQALIEASKTNQQPHWKFSDDIFSTVDWTHGSDVDLRQLYQLRARQLREKYDYLILSYSGGSDSWTVLNSFLTAGLEVDELLVRWPLKATANLFTITRNADASNILSEWELNIKPDLDYIAKHHPNIKITVYDWSDDIGNEVVEDDWYSVNDHLNPGVFRKFTVIGDKERQMIDAGKKTAIIWGVDKPQIRYKEGDLYLYFLDKLANTRCVTGVNNRTAELFFWSADCPELVHGQARVVYEYFARNPAQVHIVDWEDNAQSKKVLYNTLVRSLVYPDWNPKKFQANKPDSMVWNMNDKWMFTGLTDHRYYQSWEHGLNSIKNAVDPKFHQASTSGRFEGWTGFVSPMYNLGPIYKSLDI